MGIIRLANQLLFFLLVTAIIILFSCRLIKKELMVNENNSIIKLKTKAIPEVDGYDFPEGQYIGKQRDIAVCISGGSGRSFSAAMGQVAGMQKLKIFQKMRALSCLSGSSWFATPFFYAPETIPDSVLLGSATYLSPESLSVATISNLDSNSTGYLFSQMTDENIKLALESILKKREFAPDQYFPRILGEVMLNPFGLNDEEKFIGYNQKWLNQILSQNSNLSENNFYLVRSNRPYFIGNATLINDDENNNMFNFEFTPLYSGTRQKCIKIPTDPNGSYHSPGHTPTLQFNSYKASISSNSDTLITELHHDERFHLFNLIGSCGSAPGGIADRFGLSKLFPLYNIWTAENIKNPPYGEYSIVDGGDLEDLSIVALLRRGYKKIIVFDNSAYPIGSDSKLDKNSCVKGVDSNISRLFGFKPKSTIMNNQDTQIFSSEKYDTLVAAFKKRAIKNQIPFFIDSYKILPDNPFDITPYPNSEKVTIMWIYNDKNHEWYEQLGDDVKTFMNTESNNLKNFPNYKTVFQNSEQVFALTAPQINLCANMWYYSLTSNSELKEALLLFTSDL